MVELQPGRRLGPYEIVEPLGSGGMGEVERLAARHPGEVDVLGRRGLLAAQRGERARARAISEELRRCSRPFLFGRHTYWRAAIAAWLGEDEGAVDLLRQAFGQGVEFSPSLHRAFELSPLAGHPGFAELLRPRG